MMSNDKKLLRDVTVQSFREGLFAGTSGNLSMYDRENDLMYITPSSIPYETIGEEDMMVVHLDGQIVQGPHKPSSEWRMHAFIYRELPGVNAIVHTHSPYATAFAVNNVGIPIILIEMVGYLGGDIPLAKFALPGTDEVGMEAIKVLRQGSTCCLLANHGALAVGADIHQAHTRAVYTEDAAKIYSIACMNGPVVTMTREDINAMKMRRSAPKEAI